ncbi:lantibiotic dehydratase [Streptomyces sp. NPDC059070]|uniref:lantibiotic dehydratase n=1 Tax=Streptomyces sp. NPDC059070 TaxID=3346713 RepID=UPI0036A8F4EA
MLPEPVFCGLPDLLIRLAVAPASAAEPVSAAPPSASRADRDAQLRRLLADPVLREAIEVSSGSLTHTLERLERGEALDDRALERALHSATRYLLRMAQRPTPFGLQAGVAAATPGERACFRLGGAHRKGVWPDAEWAARVADARLKDPSARGTVRVITSNLCTERGARLVLPSTRTPGERGTDLATGEITVARSKLTDHLLRTARAPITLAELVDDAARRFPQAPAGALDRAVDTLVAEGFLLCDGRPRQHDTADAVAALAPEAATCLRAYADAPLGTGQQAWRAAVGALDAIAPHGTRQPLHVVLAMDAEVTVPAEVVAEAERAATALWRMAPQTRGPLHLTQYHKEFLERYGAERLVPVQELLDPVTGLGAPAGYLLPPSARSDVEVRSARERDDLLGDLVSRAFHAGRDEIVLDEETVAALSFDDIHSRPPALDLFGQLHAADCDALSDGDFTLVLGPACGSHSAGAISGRFWEVTGSGPVVRPVVGSRAGREEPVAAQLVFRPVLPRSANISRVPLPGLPKIVVGEFDDTADPTGSESIPLDDLAVRASFGGFQLLRRSSGQQIAVVVPHALDLSTSAPNIARFLAESQHVGLHAWTPWYWGRLEVLPHLPRVRYGRSVLNPARWRPTPQLADAAQEPARWPAALDEWRRAFRVPEHVLVAVSDKRLDVDLTHHLHRELFRHELARRPDLAVFESVGDRHNRFGWSAGHANEIVFPLVPRADGPVPSPAPRIAARPRHDRPTHHIGGAWLSVKLLTPPPEHEHLLTRELPVLLGELDESVRSWHFVRYADPEPHLRLRVEAREGAGSTDLLPAFHDWTRRLYAEGLIRDVSLHTFAPEAERYGGDQALASALEVFHTDSVAVVTQLQHTVRGRLRTAREVLAAATCADLLKAALGGSWADWALNRLTWPATATVRPYRREAMALIDPDATTGTWPDHPGLQGLRDAWAHRAAAMAAHARVIDETGPGTAVRDRALSGVLHMHVNRALGLTREGESLTYAVLRDSIRSHRARTNHLRTDRTGHQGRAGA